MHAGTVGIRRFADRIPLFATQKSPSDQSSRQPPPLRPQVTGGKTPSGPPAATHGFAAGRPVREAASRKFRPPDAPPSLGPGMRTSRDSRTAGIFDDILCETRGAKNIPTEIHGSPNGTDCRLRRTAETTACARRHVEEGARTALRPDVPAIAGRATASCARENNAAT